jgi:hypothetical protein
MPSGQSITGFFFLIRVKDQGAAKDQAMVRSGRAADCMPCGGPDQAGQAERVADAEPCPRPAPTAPRTADHSSTNPNVEDTIPMAPVVTALTTRALSMTHRNCCPQQMDPLSDPEKRE